MKQQLLQKLVDIAQAEVGTTEQGGNNLGPRIKVYQQATWLNPGAWPWCAAFMCWVMREWLTKVNGSWQALGLEDDIDATNWRCRDASAFGWIKWAKNKGLYVTDEKELAKAGDIVVFDFSHIGIVAHDQAPGSNTITTIEGNTNGKGLRDSLLGDGVWVKERKVNIVQAYIRLLQ